MESCLIRKRNDIEFELRRGVRDPRRKKYLLARLLQLENDCGKMGFTPEEIKTGELSYNQNAVESKSPLPEWAVSNSKPNEPKQQNKPEEKQSNFERVQAAKNAVYAAYEARFRTKEENKE